MSENQDKKKMSSAVTRVISAVVLGVILVPTVLLGGYVWFAAVVLISFCGLFEFYRVFGIEKSWAGFAGYAAAAVFYLMLGLDKAEEEVPVTVLSVLVILAFYVLDFDHMDARKSLASVTGYFYTVVIMSYLYRIRVMDGGMYMVWLAVISSWGTDTLAYETGRRLGKHKMTPVLSPKKTVEGAVGGFLGAVLLGLLYGILLNSGRVGNPPIGHPVIACPVIAGVASLFSMIGDLLASAFKRDRGVKDYSNLIPGHGGILDRFDSLMFIAPAIYYLALLFM